MRVEESEVVLGLVGEEDGAARLTAEFNQQSLQLLHPTVVQRRLVYAIAVQLSDAINAQNILLVIVIPLLYDFVADDMQQHAQLTQILKVEEPERGGVGSHLLDAPGVVVAIQMNDRASLPEALYYDAID